jgi:hypothetical protein
MLDGALAYRHGPRHVVESFWTVSITASCSRRRMRRQQCDLAAVFSHNESRRIETSVRYAIVNLEPVSSRVFTQPFPTAGTALGHHHAFWHSSGRITLSVWTVRTETSSPRSSTSEKTAWTTTATGIRLWDGSSTHPGGRRRHPQTPLNSKLGRVEPRCSTPFSTRSNSRHG